MKGGGVGQRGREWRLGWAWGVDLCERATEEFRPGNGVPSKEPHLLTEGLILQVVVCPHPSGHRPAPWGMIKRERRHCLY